MSDNFSMTLADLIIGEINAIPVVGPDDITIGRIERETGRQKQYVADLLEGLYADGILTKCKAYDPTIKKQCNAYRPAPGVAAETLRAAVRDRLSR